MKVIFHIDMNSFYASCHIALNPSLYNKPVAISGPSRRAIVSTANYVARSYGVTSAMPLYQAKGLCPNLIVIDHNFEIYVDFAQKLFEFISKTYTNKIEVASIDECYIDVTDLYPKYKTVKNLAIDMQQRVLTNLGLPNSIGISYNKPLAKLGSDLHKPMGITLIRREDIKSMVYPLEVTHLWGVGKQISQCLKELEIKTIGDLATYSNYDLLETKLGVITASLVERARGGGSDVLNFEHNQQKQIGNETTLEYDLFDFEEIKKMMYLLAKHVALRGENRTLVGNIVYITLKYSNRQRHNKQRKLISYTNSVDEIYPNAIKLFEEGWNGEPIRLIGVGLKGIISKYDVQEQLNFETIFSTVPQSSSEKIIKAINKAFRHDVLLTGQKLEEKKYLLQSQSKYIQSDRQIIDETKIRRKKWVK